MSTTRGRTRKKTELTWTALSSSTINDPRPADPKRPPGQPHPQVIVTQLIDNLGRHWERWGSDDPVMLGTPPVENGEGG